MTRAFLSVGFIALAAAMMFASPHGAREPSRVLRIPDVVVEGNETVKKLDPVYVHFAAPPLANKRRVKLWATHYSVPRVNAVRGEDGVPLLDIKGNELGPRLALKDFCRAAMEGTVAVSSKRGRRLYDFDGIADTQQADCTEYYPRHGAIGKSRFKRGRGIHGSGAGGRNMIPYRTVAVDPRLIPLGSVLFIPAARGTVVTLDDGETQIHDGYFYAGDTGGSIDGNHVDVFIGYSAWNPFSFVKSHMGDTFDAYLVEEPLVREAMLSAHAPLDRSMLSQR
jgi:3D (Asp-Asp-Asp) domain-containing protein